LVFITDENEAVLHFKAKLVTLYAPVLSKQFPLLLMQYPSLASLLADTGILFS